MGQIRNKAYTAFRDFETDGVSSSGLQEPDKAEVRAAFDEIDAEIQLLLDAQGGGLIGAVTWTELSGITGSFVGQVAEVPSSDAGTHTDPVVGGSKANAGRYSWRTSPGTGWRWDSADALSTKAPIASPALTGTPTAPTQSAGNNSTRIATTAFVAAADALLAARAAALEAVFVSDTAKSSGMTLETADGVPWLAYDGYNVLFADKDLAAKDARNIAYSQAVRQRIVTAVPNMSAQYNGIAGYPAQSFDFGAEAWPALWSSSAPADFYTSGDLAALLAGVKFLGNDIRPSVTDSDDYVANGGSSTFQTAKGNVRSSDTIMSAAAAAALTPGDGNGGETALLTGSQVLTTLHAQAKGLSGPDTSKLVVPSALGVSGLWLSAQLKTGYSGSTFYYGRYSGTNGFLQALKAAAGVSTSQLMCIVSNQGQSDYFLLGTSVNRTTHYSQISALYNDMCTDARSVFGQTVDPAFFIILPGGNGYTRDLDGNGNPDLFVAMALQEYARSNRGKVFIVGPDYHTTDKGNHPDSNGQRWLGAKLGMVMHRVLVERRDWEPNWIIAVEVQKGRRIIDVHCQPPEPPLVLNLAWANGTAYFTTEYPFWGFFVRDAATGSPSSLRAPGDGNENYIIITPEIVAKTVIRLRLSRDPVGHAMLYYTSEPGSGYGLISDSARPDALLRYLYKSGSGQYANTNQASLNNNPYNLANYLCPGAFPMNWEASR